jgi:hypothetical protein
MKEDKLKKIIQGIELDEPGAAFTDNIMKMVEAQEELNLHPTLLPFIQNEVLAEPDAAFSATVMANIKPRENTIAAPIITKKIKLIMVGIVTLCLLLALVIPHSNVTRPESNIYFTQLNTNLREATLGLIKIAGTILPYLIPLSILLLLDYFLRARQNLLGSKG